MPFVPAPNIVQAEIRATLDGQNIENRIMIDVLTTPTPTIVEDVAVLVNDWTQATYFDHIPSAVSLRSIVATDLSAADGSQHTITPSGPFVGALSNPPEPNEVTFCVSLRTGSRGRSARGRFYVLAVQKADVVGNYIDSGRAASYVSDLDTLIADVIAAGWALSIVSYITDGAPRVGGPVYYPVVNATFIDLAVDSMKRRKPGVGS
jgi:hypothetical protein